MKTLAWVDNGGIVGRGVLLDYAAWADAKGLKPDIFSPTTIPVSTLEDIATQQGTVLRKGDIIFIRSGYIRAYDKLTPADRQALADNPLPPAIGLESSETTLRWIWEQQPAAIVGDHPSMEAWPCQDTKFFLHEWLLAGWGLPIGELFDLERLSEECRKRKRWTFFFSSMPLKVSRIDTELSTESRRESFDGMLIVIGHGRRGEPTKWCRYFLRERKVMHTIALTYKTVIFKSIDRCGE